MAATRSPLAAWRRGVRWPLVSIGVVLLIVLVVGACEAAGWPFLVTPVQDWLGRTLARRVVFAAGPQGEGRVRIGLVGSVRVTAPSIEIGAPDWSRAGAMLKAHDAHLSLGYLDLWRAWRGGPLHVRDLEAADLDAVLERQADGRASWQFGSKSQSDAAGKPATLPTFGRLRVGDGHLVYDDAVLPAHVDARFALDDGSDVAAAVAGASNPAASSADAAAAASAAEGSASVADAGRGIVVRAGRPATSASAVAERVVLAPGQRGLNLEAVGSYRKLPLRIELRTNGVLGLFVAGADARAQPLQLLASIGRADLSFQGSTTDPLHFAGLKGRFTLAGPSLAAVGDPLGITLPTTPAFKARGSIAKEGELWNAVFDSAAIGSSRLTGAFTYDKRPKVPLLSGRLGGARLVLADLGPAVGTPAGGAPAAARGGDRVIPDREFDLPSLRAMDANVVVDIAMFDPGTTLIEPLRPVRAHILLADGVLTLADFDGRTADGRFVGYLRLDGREPQARWTADMRALGLDMAKWLRIERKDGQPPYVAGRLDAMIKVTGRGRSAAEILSTLDGDVRAHLRDGAISHLAIEAAGIDVAQALGVFLKGDDALPVLCNVADLDVSHGIVTPKVFVINTRDSTVWVDGTISLKTEGLDLKAVVSPKDFSPLSLRTPVHVTGVFGKPAVSLELGKLAGKGAAAALLALLNPLAAIVPFVDPGSRDAARRAGQECANLVKTSGRIARPTRTPAELHVPAAALRPAAPASAAGG